MPPPPPPPFPPPPQDGRGQAARSRPATPPPPPPSSEQSVPPPPPPPPQTASTATGSSGAVAMELFPPESSRPDETTAAGRPEPPPAEKRPAGFVHEGPLLPPPRTRPSTSSASQRSVAVEEEERHHTSTARGLTSTPPAEAGEEPASAGPSHTTQATRQAATSQGEAKPRTTTNVTSESVRSSRTSTPPPQREASFSQQTAPSTAQRGGSPSRSRVFVLGSAVASPSPSVAAAAKASWVPKRSHRALSAAAISGFVDMMRLLLEQPVGPLWLTATSDSAPSPDMVGAVTLVVSRFRRFDRAFTWESVLQDMYVNPTTGIVSAAAYTPLRQVSIDDFVDAVIFALQAQMTTRRGGVPSLGSVDDVVELTVHEVVDDLRRLLTAPPSHSPRAPNVCAFCCADVLIALRDNSDRVHALWSAVWRPDVPRSKPSAAPTTAIPFVDLELWLRRTLPDASPRLEADLVDMFCVAARGAISFAEFQVVLGCILLNDTTAHSLGRQLGALYDALTERNSSY